MSGHCYICGETGGHAINCPARSEWVEQIPQSTRPAPVQVPDGMAVIPTERYEQLLACEDAMVSLVKTGCIPAEIAGRTLLAASPSALAAHEAGAHESQIAALMPCGAAVRNVYEAYDAGKKEGAQGVDVEKVMGLVEEYGDYCRECGYDIARLQEIRALLTPVL